MCSSLGEKKLCLMQEKKRHCAQVKSKVQPYNMTWYLQNSQSQKYSWSAVQTVKSGTNDLLVANASSSKSSIPKYWVDFMGKTVTFLPFFPHYDLPEDRLKLDSIKVARRNKKNSLCKIAHTETIHRVYYSFKLFKF